MDRRPRSARPPRRQAPELGPPGRPVRLLAAGGTIAMQGERALVALDADALVAAVPQLGAFGPLTAETVFALPGPQIGLADALALARRACAAGDAGDGIVITTGTDTLEELAVLCALLYAGHAPIVLTGANRPASPRGDRPATCSTQWRSRPSRTPPASASASCSAARSTPR